MSTSSTVINGRQGQCIQGGPSGMCLNQVVQRYCRRVWKHDLKIRAVSFGALETWLWQTCSIWSVTSCLIFYFQNLTHTSGFTPVPPHVTTSLLPEKTTVTLALSRHLKQPGVINNNNKFEKFMYWPAVFQPLLTKLLKYSWALP